MGSPLGKATPVNDFSVVNREHVDPLALIFLFVRREWSHLTNQAQ
jgi:hypothetical protein